MSKKRGEQIIGDASGDDRSDLFMAYRGNHSALLNTSNNPNRVSPLIPRYEPKPSSRVAAFTSPNDSNKLGLIAVPNRQTPPIPVRPSSSGPKTSDAADENVVKPNGFAASKTTNNTVYQKALKSFLGGREVVTMVSPPQLGLPPSGPTTPSIPRAVKPKRSVLDDNDASHGTGGIQGPPNTAKPKRTLLSSGAANSHTKDVTQDEIGYSTFDSISRGAPLKRVLTSNTGSDSYQKPASNSKDAIPPGAPSLGGSQRRPNSAPIKDKDKDKLKPKPNAKGWGEIESRGYQKEGLLRPSNGPPSHLSNSIYNGPVIKKKVLNN